MGLPAIEFQPGVQLVQALRHWWLIVLLGVAGGLAGMLFSTTHSPVFEASAALGMDIAYGSTQRLELVVEDRVMGRVSALIESDQVMSRVLAALPADLRSSRGWSTPADLRVQTRIEKRLGTWLLTVDDRDPGVAAQVANVWITQAIAELDTAVTHAWKAVGLQSGPFIVDCVQVQSETSDVPGLDWAAWRCSVEPIHLTPEALNGQLQNELQLSQGVLPVIAYSLLQRASPPREPVLWGRGTLVLAGTLIGLLIGFSVSVFWRARPTVGD